MSVPPTDHAPLHDAAFEHDGCGVGFVADIAGRRSHAIVERAVQAVRCVAHRGAVDADEATGDGAGLSFGLPASFFRAEYERLTRLRPAQGPIGVGVFFLPRRRSEAYPAFKSLVEEVLLKRRLSRFVWREVPVDVGVLGEKALATKPEIEQLLVAFGDDVSPLKADRALYAARKEIEARAAQSVNTGLYIASFSARAIVYKGLMTSTSLADFYPDLLNPDFESAFGIFHQRYSTNTFPNWQLAQPFRMSAHNGEINTIAGNRNWTRARENELASPVWREDVAFLRPIIPEGASDSANLDNVLELLALSGRPLHHAMLMLVREAWEAHEVFNPDVAAFNEYHACLNEVWDGPAAVVFGDGEVVGATLDRNGLRPARYKITRGGLIVLGSELGLLDLDDEDVVEKGRLGPGHMLAVDLRGGRLLHGKQIKQELAARRPYGEWVEDNLLRVPEQPIELRAADGPVGGADLDRLHVCFGYSSEELPLVLEPMAGAGKDPVGSMGDDGALAVLSDRPRRLADYFKQRFAQVTNPPIDSIRERAVMTLLCNLGRRRNWLTETPQHARQVQLAGPFISDADLDEIARRRPGALRRIAITWDRERGVAGMLDRLDAVCAEAEDAAAAGREVIVLTDRDVGPDRVPIPVLLAVGAVNNHLLRVGKRLVAGIVADSGEPRDVHDLATLIGYGAGAIVPWLAYRTIGDRLVRPGEGGRDAAALLAAYREAASNGLLKTMAKMGISVLGSYRGAQIFEAIGISREVIARCFVGTPSRLGGIGLNEIGTEALLRHDRAFGAAGAAEGAAPDDAGFYRFKKGGEPHGWSPDVQRAILAFRKRPSAEGYGRFKTATRALPPLTLRDLLDYRATEGPVPIEEVEPVEAIRRRFTTAGMSLGALSPEAHEDLAIAMNRIGALSNTGEGGEDPARFAPLPNGDSRNSGIKQVASGRFGVTPTFLVHASEIEIKMAQGSKPGEGGQLPGHKVTALIARLRRSVPGVTLISPPPHHDIYSIEDLAQLIYDLKQVSPEARICVKLVAEAGVGTIAAGVAKAQADIILVSGHDGGTGASPLASIMHAGAPWELGLAEAQQVLVMNGVRERVALRTDGGIKTGRDVVIAAMLGADGFNFGTAALVALGCRYVRQCHLNTCPVGIATQRDDLREKYAGRPEQLIAYVTAVAQEVRETLAQLGFRSLDEVIGRADLLQQVRAPDRPKANLLDLSPLLVGPPPGAPRHRVWERNTPPAPSLDDRIVRHAQRAIEHATPVKLRYRVRNTDRTIGARLAGEIARRHGEAGLAPGTVEVWCEGTAGQSFAAFCVEGMRLVLSGEANDYVGKGMNGGEVVIRPSANARRDAETDVIIGNTVLYGATGGQLFVRGMAGERFAVRNSGAQAVIEGVGDHGCEYMTNGVVVVLGNTGRNFGAGMTGGIAYVYDERERFGGRVNHNTVTLTRLSDPAEIRRLRDLTLRHAEMTASPRAERLLDRWEETVPLFWKVVPREGDHGAQEAERDEAPGRVGVGG